MTETQAIFCCGCQVEVEAVLVDGRECYPHRPDLFSLPFWKCPTCKNFVGCHHKTPQRTRPLGNIPTKEIKAARQHIHRILDPIWKNKVMPRGRVYGKLSKMLGYSYHTGEIKSVEEARKIYAMVKQIAAEAA